MKNNMLKNLTLFKTPHIDWVLHPSWCRQSRLTEGGPIYRGGEGELEPIYEEGEGGDDVVSLEVATAWNESKRNASLTEA
jgi:hypothetical protein